MAAARTVALLNAQAEALREELKRLRQSVADVRKETNADRSALIVEANERLVLAALNAESAALTAISDLGALAQTSQRDPLTKTPNRALMHDRLVRAIALARRRGTRLAVVFLDLDEFKKINDTLGHAAGDEVLQIVTHRLEQVVRDSDTVSRHSGDEFLVLLAEVSQASDAGAIATKMLAALAEPFDLGDQAVHLSASLGISVYPEDGDDAATLVSRADVAMYQSKRYGRGGFEFYNSAALNRGPVQQVKKVALSSGETQARDLREVNEQLVISALTAQALERSSDAAHRHQITFLAMVAHELRNPLAPLRAAAELLSRAHANEPLLTRLQLIIVRQVRRMARLVEDLLDASRGGSGKFHLERASVEMGSVLAMAVEACRPTIDQRQQTLHVQLPVHLPELQGDALRLIQVFSNLMDNASRYTPEGGEITLNAMVSDAAIEVTVSDTGIGITATALPTIFDLFVQETRAVELRRGGMGIGLAVVRELVLAHGGTVVARSTGPNLGSEFVVTLPLREPVVA